MVVSFIESRFGTKVEYQAWLSELARRDSVSSRERISWSLILHDWRCNPHPGDSVVVLESEYGHGCVTQATVLAEECGQFAVRDRVQPGELSLTVPAERIVPAYSELAAVVGPLVVAVSDTASFRRLARACRAVPCRAVPGRAGPGRAGQGRAWGHLSVICGCVDTYVHVCVHA